MDACRHLAIAVRVNNPAACCGIVDLIDSGIVSWSKGHQFCVLKRENGEEKAHIHRSGLILPDGTVNGFAVSICRNGGD